MTEYTMAFKHPHGNTLIWRNCKVKNEKEANEKLSTDLHPKGGYLVYSGAMLESNYTGKKSN